MSHGLNDKQKAFADEYIITLNGRKSYKKVYEHIKKDSTADTNACNLLKNPKVKAYIDSKLAKIDKESIAKAEEVMEYLTKVMRGETIEEVIAVVGTGEGCSKAIKVEKIPSEKDKLKAAELLGKRYRLFTEKQEITGAVQVQFFGEGDILD